MPPSATHWPRSVRTPGDRESGRRGFGEEAAIAGPLGVAGEDRDLPVEPEDAAIDDWLVRQYGRVVDEVPGREVVRPVNNNVVWLKDLKGILGRESGLMENNFCVGIDLAQGLLSRLQLRGTYITGAMKDLALQIGDVDNIKVDQP